MPTSQKMPLPPQKKIGQTPNPPYIKSLEASRGVAASNNQITEEI